MALVRLYYIDPQGKAAYITCDNDQVLTDGEYLFQWQLKLNLPRGKAMALVVGGARVPAKSETCAYWHACNVARDICFMPSVRLCMQTAVKYTPDNAAYGLVFLNAASWEPAQYKTAKAIVQDRLKEAGCLSDPAPVEATTTKKPVRVYMCWESHPAAMVEYHPDDVAVDDERAREAFKRQLLGANPEFTFFSRVTVPGERVGVSHGDDLLGNPGFAESLNRAISLAACCCPDRAPYSIAFLRGHGTNAAIRITKEWRESFDDKYTAPQPATTAPADPILHWYTLNKEAKDAEEALLAKLREALVEKAKDPALNPTGTPFDDTVADLLKALSASTENIAFLGHPGRFAAYEACGLRFGPVLGDSPLRLSTLDPVGALSWQVRMTDLPWVSKEQK